MAAVVRTRRGVAAVVVLLAATAALAAVRISPAAGDRCGGSRWVAAWTSPPQDAGGDFRDQTLRTIATVTAPGDAVRVTLSNRFGDRAVLLDDVHVARRASGAAVERGTVRRVTFGGEPLVRVPAGGEVRSDPVAFEVAAGDDVAVSFHVGGPVALDRHIWSMHTHYATEPGAGRHGADVSGDAFRVTSDSSFGVVAVDVHAPGSTGAVVALGDSLTEGIGSTLDAGRRWPDLLAARLGGRTAVLNAGIGGNHVSRPYALPRPDGSVHDFGQGAVDRLHADVLGRAGVTDLVVYAGINDVFTQLDDDVVGTVTAAYRRIVDEARRHGIRVTGATLTPASQQGAKEADRLALNEFIRTSGLFDAVVDFDRAVADPAAPSRLLPAFDADGVHLTDVGYRALAEAFPPSVLQGTGCPAA